MLYIYIPKCDVIWNATVKSNNEYLHSAGWIEQAQGLRNLVLVVTMVPVFILSGEAKGFKVLLIGHKKDSPRGRKPRTRAVLPCWTAMSKHV